jgi:hypothetical protein
MIDFSRCFATKSSKEGAASLGSMSHAAILGSSPTKPATEEEKKNQNPEIIVAFPAFTRCFCFCFCFFFGMCDSGV